MLKQLSFLLGISLVLFATVSRAEEMEIPVGTLLAPTYGYELKNDVQVVVYGFLPNSCYSLSETRIEKDLDHRLIKIRQLAYRDRTGICEDEKKLPSHMLASIPFTTEVSIGNLAVGDFTIIYEKSGEGTAKRFLNIAPNVTPRTDSFPYAVISSASVPDVINGVNPIEVVLTGVLTSTCMELNDEVKVIQESDVFVLMPTVKMKTGVICADAIIPFEKKLDLGKVAPGRYLLHARSMNGRAINRIFQVAR